MDESGDKENPSNTGLGVGGEGDKNLGKMGHTKGAKEGVGNVGMQSGEKVTRGKSGWQSNRGGPSETVYAGVVNPPTSGAGGAAVTMERGPLPGPAKAVAGNSTGGK